VKKSLPFVTVISLSAIAAACSSSNTGNSATGSDSGTTAGSGNATLHAGTSVVPQSLADVANVQPDRVVFPAAVASQLSGYKAGNILLSDRQSSAGAGGNPNGFLRKVVSISQGAAGVTVMTSPAVLQEAVDALQFQSTLQVPPLTMSGPSTQSRGDLHTLGSGSTNIKLLDYSGTQLLNYTDTVALPGSQSIGFNAHAKVTTGTLDFSPSYDVGADLGFLTINSFHANATGTLTANLVLEAGVTLQTTLDSKTFTALVAQAITKSTSTTLASYNVNLGSISAGPINLPASAQFTATLACQFAWGGGPDVTIGGTATGSVTAGLTYQDGSLAPNFSDSFKFTQTGPNYTAGGIVQAFCAVTPKLELQLFGVATADLTANAYAGAGGDLTCGGKQVGDSGVYKTDAGTAEGEVNGQLIAGVSATIDAQVNILGLYKWNKSCVLFNEYVNKNYTDTFALPGGPTTTCSSTQKYKPLPLPTVNGSACFGSTKGGDAGPVGVGQDAGGPDSATTSGKDSGTTGKDSGATGKDATTDGAKDSATGDGSVTTAGDAQVPNIADAAWDGSFDATDDGPVVKNEAGIIEGSCTHDVCTAGIRLGQQCNECTLTICKVDPYCCDTLWGPSCFTDVQKYCGQTCPN